MDEFHGTAGVLLDSSPQQVFEVLVDVVRLPDWNAKVHHVIEAPDGPVVEDSEWVVQMRAMGTRWPSRSHATVVDPAAGRFEHTSRTDDGNPSYGMWAWEVLPDIRGSELSVTWAIYVKTFGRRHFAAPLRKPRLEAEVRTTLAGLNTYVGSLDPACS